MAYTTKAIELQSCLQIRASIEAEFRTLIKKNRTEADVTLIALQRILRHPGKINAG